MGYSAPTRLRVERLALEPAREHLEGKVGLVCGDHVARSLDGRKREVVDRIVLDIARPLPLRVGGAGQGRGPLAPLLLDRQVD